MGDSDQRISQIIGKRIRELRRGQGLTLDQLSQASGMPPESISRIEGGRSMPRLDSVEKLAAGLGMDLKTLVNLDDAPTVALLAVPVEARGVALLLEGRSADTIARVRRAVEVVLEAEDV